MVWCFNPPKQNWPNYFQVILYSATNNKASRVLGLLVVVVDCGAQWEVCGAAVVNLQLAMTRFQKK